jgi:hypothetical protein
MAKKKKVTEPVKVVEEVKDELDIEIDNMSDEEFVEAVKESFGSLPDLAIEPETVSTPALPDKMVRVRNQGLPFLCDLTAYGYGLRWPTNAVYTIPTSKYIQLLKQGLEGVSA